MRWIETLELRSISGEDPLKEIDLQTLVINMPLAGKPYLILLCRHSNVEGDICVHLLFDTDKVLPEGSEPGLQIKEVLQGAGLVSHKIWIESKSFQVQGSPEIN